MPTPSRRPRLGALLGATAALLLLAPACARALPDFDADQVERAVADRTADRAGAAPSSVVCAGGLEPEVDAATTCTYRLDERSYDATVTVVEVDDTDVRFDVAVDRTYLDADALTSLVAAEAEQMNEPGEVRCREDVDIASGARAYCSLQSGEERSDLAVTITRFSSSSIELAVEVDDRAATERGE